MPVLNRAVCGNVPVLDRAVCGNVPVLDRAVSGNVPVLDRAGQRNVPVLDRAVSGKCACPRSRGLWKCACPRSRRSTKCACPRSRGLWEMCLSSIARSPGNVPVLDRAVSGNVPGHSAHAEASEVRASFGLGLRMAAREWWRGRPTQFVASQTRLGRRLLLLRGRRGGRFDAGHGDADVGSTATTAHEFAARHRGHGENALTPEVRAHDSNDFVAGHQMPPRRTSKDSTAAFSASARAGALLSAFTCDF